MDKHICEFNSIKIYPQMKRDLKIPKKKNYISVYQSVVYISKAWVISDKYILAAPVLSS